jgi:hypothetical protein
MPKSGHRRNDGYRRKQANPRDSPANSGGLSGLPAGEAESV